MPGRTPDQALEAFLAPIRRAISCVTRDIPVVGTRPYEPGKILVLTLSGGQAVKLRGDAGLHLTISQWFKVVRTEDPQRGPFKVSTTGYFYEILDADRQELYGYHWHPASSSHYTGPHLHSRGTDPKLHVPTGRIAIENVIDLAIERGAEPLRDDWQEILSDAIGTFETWRTWHGSQPPS